MKNLTVKIPEKYRKDLEARFDIENASNGQIFVNCPICTAFLSAECGGCPFKKFANKHHKGCIAWVDTILGRDSRFVIGPGTLGIYPYGAKTDLKNFVRKAKKYIKWVK